MLNRKVYNNDFITFFSVYQRLQSPRVIMCCSPHRFAGRAATHYHTRALQTLIHGKECFILLLTTQHINYARASLFQHYRYKVTDSHKHTRANYSVHMCTTDACNRGTAFHLSLVARKPLFGVSDQVRYKPDYTRTEDG